MKANELRLGNLIATGVKYKDTSVIGKVLSIGLEECEFEQIYCECTESFEWFFKDNYCGIPLTPSILEAAGFEKLNNAWIIVQNGEKIGDYNFSLFDHNYCSGELKLKYNVANGPIPEVVHLHQLQNIYFVLTGTELVIDIEKL